MTGFYSVGRGSTNQVPGGVESLSEAEKGRCKVAKDANGKEVVTVCSGEESNQSCFATWSIFDRVLDSPHYILEHSEKFPRWSGSGENNQWCLRLGLAWTNWLIVHTTLRFASFRENPGRSGSGEAHQWCLRLGPASTKWLITS